MRTSAAVRGDLMVLASAVNAGFVEARRAAWLRLHLEEELQAAELAEKAIADRMAQALHPANFKHRLPEGCGE